MPFDPNGRFLGPVFWGGAALPKKKTTKICAAVTQQSNVRAIMEWFSKVEGSMELFMAIRRGQQLVGGKRKAVCEICWSPEQAPMKR